jgi:hypothetical protein
MNATTPITSSPEKTMTRIAINKLSGVRQLDRSEMQATVGGIVAPTPDQIPKIKKLVCRFVFNRRRRPRLVCRTVLVPNPDVRF